MLQHLLSVAEVNKVLTCMCPHVCFEMGALGVGFPTSGELAVVRRCAFSGPRPAASFLLDAPGLILPVKLQQGRRRWRSEHHPLHGSWVMLLVHAHGLSVHVVLSLKLRHTLVRVLWMVLGVHVVVLEMVLIRMMKVGVQLCQMAVCARVVLHGVRSKSRPRTWNRNLVVHERWWNGGAHLMSHQVPTSSSHHTRLANRLGFNFVSKRWIRGHLVMSSRNWDRI